MAGKLGIFYFNGSTNKHKNELKNVNTEKVIVIDNGNKAEPVVFFKVF
jgi:hypothetical protein